MTFTKTPMNLELYRVLNGGRLFKMAQSFEANRLTTIAKKREARKIRSIENLQKHPHHILVTRVLTVASCVELILD